MMAECADVDDENGLMGACCGGTTRRDCQEVQVEGELLGDSTSPDVHRRHCGNVAKLAGSLGTGLTTLPSQSTRMERKEITCKDGLVFRSSEAEALSSQQDALADLGALVVITGTRGRGHVLRLERMYPLGCSPTSCRLQSARLHHASLGNLQFVVRRKATKGHHVL